MISAQEQIDLDEMKQKIQEIKLDAIEYQLFLSRNGIEGTRHKSLPDAYVFVVSHAVEKIRKLQRDHTKKYPDEM